MALALTSPADQQPQPASESQISEREKEGGLSYDILNGKDAEPSQQHVF